MTLIHHDKHVRTTINTIHVQVSLYVALEISFASHQHLVMSTVYAILIIPTDVSRVDPWLACYIACMLWIPDSPLV